MEHSVGIQPANAPAGLPVRPRDSVTIGELRTVISRNWRSFLTGSVVGTVIGIVIVVAWPATYTSTLRLWVRDVPVSIDPGIESQRNLTIDTEAQRVRSQEVALRSGVTVGGDSPVEAIDLTAPVNSKILQIRVRADSPEAAQSSAAALGSAYLAVRKAFLTERRDSTVARLDHQIQRLGAKVAAAPSETAQMQWRSALSATIVLRDKARSARTTGGTVTTSATQPVQAGRNPSVLPVSLAIIGGSIGLIVNLWRRQLEDKE